MLNLQVIEGDITSVDDPEIKKKEWEDLRVQEEDAKMICGDLINDDGPPERSVILSGDREGYLTTRSIVRRTDLESNEEFFVPEQDVDEGDLNLSLEEESSTTSSHSCSSKDAFDFDLPKSAMTSEESSLSEEENSDYEHEPHPKRRRQSRTRDLVLDDDESSSSSLESYYDGKKPNKIFQSLSCLSEQSKISNNPTRSRKSPLNVLRKLLFFD